MSDNHVQGPEVFSQVNDGMKSVIDMTSRIDERVKIIMEKQIESDRRLLTMMDHLNSLSARVTILESRDGAKLEAIIEANRQKVAELEKQVEILQLHQTSNGERWKNIFNTGLQVITAVAVGYILWKMGLPSP